MSKNKHDRKNQQFAVKSETPQPEEIMSETSQTPDSEQAQNPSTEVAENAAQQPVAPEAQVEDTAPIEQQIAQEVAAAQAPAAPAPTPVASGTVVSSAAAKVGTQATPTQVQATAVKAAPKLNLRAKYSDEALQLIERVFATNDSSAIGVIRAFDDYATDAAVGKQVTPDELARLELSLYNALGLLINTVSTNFQITFATVLKIVDDSGMTGVFGPNYIHRAVSVTRLRGKDLSAWQRLWNLLHLAAPAKNRKENLRHVDLNRTLEFGVTPEGAARVLGFFSR